jgi:hypothetical protein
MPAALRDMKGCLTEAGLHAFRTAPPGRAPAELAAHVAGCARCQDRALAADEGIAGPGKRKEAPPLWRVFALFFGGLLLAVVLFLWTRSLLRPAP